MLDRDVEIYTEAHEGGAGNQRGRFAILNIKWEEAITINGLIAGEEGVARSGLVVIFRRPGSRL
jgi:hypothetical protein